jgi:hypothetical protein
MRLVYKIIFSNLALVLLASLLVAFNDGFYAPTLFFIYGIFGMVAGVIALLISAIVFFAGNKKPGLSQGFLISGVLLLVTGFFSISQADFGR